MKLTIERAALLKALGHVQSVVERRNTIPILSNVLLAAKDGRVSFSATDLDMEITDVTAAQVKAPGQITASAHTLYEIVRKLPEGADVMLSYTGEDPRLGVAAGRSKFHLPVLPAGDFPVMSQEGLSERIVVETKDLIRLIDRTRFAISTEETRYYLNGLYLHAVTEGGAVMLRAVGTDGRRLALAETPSPEGVAGLPGVIIPRKTIQEIRRLLDDAGESIELQVSQQKVRFDLGHAALTSKVIDGAFVAYADVIPRQNLCSVMLDRDLFAAAVDRVSTIATDQSRAVRLSVETGRVTLSVRNMDASQAVEELEADYDGEPFEAGFNARYVLDVIGQMGGATADFRFAEHTAGAWIQDPILVVDPTDPAVQYVLVPLRA